MRLGLKSIRYLFEAIIVKGAFGLFRLLPLDVASAIGGFLGRNLGPYFKVTQTAKRNLKKIYPELTQQEMQRIIVEMWDNLGRVAAELPKLPTVVGKKYHDIIEIEGMGHFQRAKDRIATGKPVIFFSGHMGNWEIMPKTTHELGETLALMYRKANNDAVDRSIQNIRDSYQTVAISKTKSGTRKLLSVVKQGKPIGMLMDQRAGEGVDIPFLGHPAKTAAAMAGLAVKYDCQLVPIHIIRKGRSSRFRVVVHPPVVPEHTNDQDADIKTLLVVINDILGRFVTEYPAQWFWIHRRWK